ncbi:MAG: right-handed parallel beta-helix repeat-containing protein [Candidatus Coatesbacteria bacterium]|nr:right-handed parallel beta-helix repeat-containing protein [Candidatus Coatesbacteria bacterium]
MRVWFFTLFAAMICALMVPVVVEGRTIVVPDDYLKIQDAVYATNTGDTVFIREGTYYETSISFGEIGYVKPVRWSITICGEGMGKTIIDGSKGNYDIFIVNAPFTIIRDLTVRNSKASGICFRGKSETSMVVNCESTGNRTGMLCQITAYDQRYNTDSANPYIIGNRLVDNNYYGLYFEHGCQAQAMHNVIEGNGYAGVYCRTDTDVPCEPTIRNNFIINSTANDEVYGVAVASYTQPIIRNNVIVGFPVGAYWYSSDAAELFRNNIITECGIGISAVERLRIEYCCLYDNGEDIDNVVLDADTTITGEDPLFVDPDGMDFHLANGSPCIGTGDPRLPDGTDESNYDMSDIDMGVFGGKEVGAVCRVILSEPAKDRNGLKTYFVAEQFGDLNGNGVWDVGEPFEDLDGDGQCGDTEPFTDENHNGYWDPGEPYIDENYNSRYDKGEPFTDLNENGQWDSEREPYTDTNRNGEYDRGTELTVIGLYTCFGYEAEETDLLLAFLLENGEYFTMNPGGAWVPGAYSLLSPSPYVGDNYAFAMHAMTASFYSGFSMVDQEIGLYSLMTVANHVFDRPWKALSGHRITFTEAQ